MQGSGESAALFYLKQCPSRSSCQGKTAWRSLLKSQGWKLFESPCPPFAEQNSLAPANLQGRLGIVVFLCGHEEEAVWYIHSWSLSPAAAWGVILPVQITESSGLGWESGDRDGESWMSWKKIWKVEDPSEVREKELLRLSLKSGVYVNWDGSAYWERNTG